MGPYLRIQGAVFLDKVIYQAFTEYMWLGDDPDLDENIMRIARISCAAAKTVKNLDAYYDDLELSDIPVPSRLFPRPTFGAGDQPDFLPEKLCFESRVPGLLFDAEITKESESIHVSKKIIVKFTEEHSEVAHWLLAKHHLAPRLHFCRRSLCGLLDGRDGRVEDQDAYTLFLGKPQDYVEKDVDMAIQLLHQHGFVHGDICMSNILVIKRPQSLQKVAAPTSTEVEVVKMDIDDSGSETPGAVLIDFDWMGKDGKTNYRSKTVQILAAVDSRNGLIVPQRWMKKEYDRLMFEQLDHWCV